MQRKCGLRERKKKIFEVPSKGISMVFSAAWEDTYLA